MSNIYLTNEQKITVFEPMFKKFETKEILEYFKEVITKIPDAIFYKPASSSGKYHNKQQVGDYGQLIHIYMFFDILNMLLDLDYNQSKFSNLAKRDLLRCVPALHDMCKYGVAGKRKHTTGEHPLLAKQKLIEINKDTKTQHPLKEEDLQMLCEMCERHSGQWNTFKIANYGWDTTPQIGIMEKPRNEYDILIHECDMLASRSWLTYEVPEDLMQRFKDNVDLTHF